jgi:hypothetical protein
MNALLRRPPALFLFSALAVIAVCALVLRTQRFAAAPEVGAWGVTFDLTITIPLLYWFFIVRSGRAHAVTVAPVFLVCLALAARIVPRGEQQFLRDLKLLIVPIELLLVWAIVTRRALPPVVTRVIRSELSILWHAVVAWRKKPEPVDGYPVTFHERSGWGTIVAAFIFLIAAEGVAMHLFLAGWSTTAAWTWTGLDVWGAMWLIGDYHALRLRRSFLTADTLHLRMGLRWSADIPLSNIASVERIQGDWKKKGVLKLAIIDDPQWLVTFHEPVIVDGIAGIRKTITAMAMLPDDDAFVDALTRSAALRPD